MPVAAAWWLLDQAITIGSGISLQLCMIMHDESKQAVSAVQLLDDMHCHK